jgi:hypothetical protein
LKYKYFGERPPAGGHQILAKTKSKRRNDMFDNMIISSEKVPFWNPIKLAVVAIHSNLRMTV